MALSNKKMGSKFEEDWADYLWECNRMWVAPFPGKQGSNSQPADLIVCKDNLCMLIDCKVLSNKSGKFPLERVEMNQIMAYKRWKLCGNNDYVLAILWNGDVYYVHLDDIDFNAKSIDLKELIPVVEGFYDG